MKRIMSEKVKCIILFVLILAVLGLIGGFNLLRYCYNMNPDIASEGVFVKEVYNSREWIPSSWYPSTEVRVLYTANLAPLFYALSSDMQLSMGLACCLAAILLVVSAFFLGKLLNWSLFWRLFFNLGFICFPVSQELSNLLFSQAGYYSTHTIVLFLVLAVYAWLLNANQKSLVKKYLLMTMCVFLAFIFGLQGVRMILVLYGPLMAAELLRMIFLFIFDRYKVKKEVHITIWSILQLLASYLGSKVFGVSAGAMSRNLRNGINKLITTVIPDVWDILGGNVRSAAGKAAALIILGLVFAEVIGLIFRLVKSRKILDETHDTCSYDLWIGFVMILSPLMTIFAVAFTTIPSSPRYYYVIYIAGVYSLVDIGRQCKSGGNI